ncbi:hypothetical protein ACQKGO_18180 [Corallococcus interemptor]|uniref:hypothetical protein n=1 Tax=Corallococcus interemptor TaxID=2316720 RepID=UPI003CFF1B32
MRDQTQATHVWQHLYNPEERWNALVGTDIDALRTAAEVLGCPPQPPRQRTTYSRPQLPKVPRHCYALLKTHHDDHYGPAYLRELGEPGTEWGIQDRETQELLCCSPRGVLIAVGRKLSATVLTAFRPDLPFDSEGDADDETYHQTAHERWVGATTMRETSAWTQSLIQELEKVSREPPRRTADAWRLVRSLGHGRALRTREPALLPALDAAEALWARHRQGISSLLEGKLRTEAMQTGLALAFEAREPYALQDRLLALADLLVAFEVLGQPQEVERVLDETRELFASWPPELTGFGQLAHARIATSDAAVRRFWTAVLDAQRIPVAKAPPRESVGARVTRILGSFSLTRLHAPGAYASSGIHLGPAPLELHQQGEVRLSLTVGTDLRTPMLQVTGLARPQGTRDGLPLEFQQDEFGAWLTDALPGHYLLLLQDEPVEFTIQRS